MLKLDGITFELREYDPVIGRWTAVDPKRQYHSPYLSMGNNPVSSLDSDGGDDVYFNKDDSYARTVDRNWFIDTFIGHRGYLEGDNGSFSRVYFNDPSDAHFGGEAKVDKLTVYGGRAFNQKDFGNLLWGAALQALKVPYYPTAKMDLRLMVFGMEKLKINNGTRVNLGGREYTGGGDTQEDQNAIRNGYNRGIKHRGLNEFRFY